jgi:hypothetical protein
MPPYEEHGTVSNMPRTGQRLLGLVALHAVGLRRVKQYVSQCRMQCEDVARHQPVCNSLPTASYCMLGIIGTSRFPPFRGIE